jgi:peroxiredoxin
MRKNYQIAFYLFIFIVGCSASPTMETINDDTEKRTLVLSGKVNYPQSKGEILLQELTSTGQATTVKTITLASDNTYKVSLPVEEPGYYRLNFYNIQSVNLILDKNNVEVNVDGNKRNGFVEVKGSSDLDFITRVNQLFAEFQQHPEVVALNQEFNKAAQAGDQKKMDVLRDKYIEMDKNIRAQAHALIRKSDNTLAIINLLGSAQIADKDRDFDLFLEVAERLGPKYPESSHVREFVEMVNKMKVLAVGQQAPEIALPTPDGEVVPLSSLRGKYVLVDFWAKWCGPCRVENPNVVKMYKKYNAKGFEVYGVSLDRNRQDWLQAIKEDGLTWTHVSDLKFWNSEAAKTYNITSIPFAVLLDPEGKIIAKNLRGIELERKLDEIFGNR